MPIESKLTPEISVLAKQFIEEWMFNPDQAFGRCFSTSCRFSGELTKHRIDHDMIMMSGHQSYENGSFNEGEVPTHYVVYLYDDELTIDFTYRQFDSTCFVPRIKTIQQLREEWDEVVVESYTPEQTNAILTKGKLFRAAVKRTKTHGDPFPCLSPSAG